MRAKHSNPQLTYAPAGRIFFILGLIMLGSEIWKQITLTFLSPEMHYNWWYFPFQLCSIPMYLLTAYPFVHERIKSVILMFLMCYGTLGGIAVFADTSGLHYQIRALTVHSYLWHILLILTGIYSAFVFYRKSRQTPPIRCFLYSTLLYFICCTAATVLNLSLDRYGNINMFYINPHIQMQQIVFRELVPLFGNTVTILIYIASSVTGSLLLFFIWKFIFTRLFRN